MNEQINPSHIMQTATAFWASKVLLTGVEFDLFTLLDQGSMTGQQIEKELEFHPRGTYDFLDALVALGFLQREGDGTEGLYSNTADTAAFLNRNSPAYIGGLANMLNTRLFGFWNNLGTALKTGEAQNEIRVSGKPLFEELYSDHARLGVFLEAMTGFQAANFQMLADKFDFSRYKTVSDIGGALALLSRIIATTHSHLTFTSFDMQPVEAHAKKCVESSGMEDRISLVSGDFFSDELPKADVVTMGNILHDWNLDNKKMLIAKAYDALPAGGAFIAIENLIDDARRENAFGLMMSLNMLIETGDGFDYTGQDFRNWCSEAGFRHFEFIPLAGPTSAAVAYK